MQETYLERLSNTRRNILIVLRYGTVIPFNWNTKGYRCFYCSKQMKDCENLKEHTMIKHAEVNLEDFIPKRIISKDVPVKIDVTQLGCKYCPDSPLSTLEDLFEHLKINHGESFESTGVCFIPFVLNKDVMRCVICESQFDNFSSMISHMNKEHINHACICQICGLSFIDQVRLKRHISNSHIGHRCSICGKMFEATHKLEKHKQRIHGLMKIHECNLCSATFENKYRVKVHMGKVHNVEKYRIQCEHCPKICTTKGAMLLHVQSLHSELRYECDLCDYKTGIKWMIKLHKRKHFGEKDYFCSICERSFGRSSNLRAHMKVHTGAVGRVCRFCRRGFVNLECLNQHEYEFHYFDNYE
ncbi:zinc finger protein 1 homolog [Manduca sexta]|uniref:C2H2-type domain-containing protein n=1 Tax=Manduca sexta TaxID=7130 RepID=A0A922CUT1_MANSE|nr:zinc finger protein 1 homolog [Manduca sexta]KAG6460265.1 hypothetical protein O3G_MSEX011873 [Manduca sexta]